MTSKNLNVNQIWNESISDEELLNKMIFILRDLGFSENEISQLNYTTPQNFYKYMSVNKWTASLVEREYASFAHATEFNDELDSVMPYDVENDDLVVYNPEFEVPYDDPAKLADYQKQIDRMFHLYYASMMQQNVYVYSMTDRPDSLALWGWYSNNAGVVFEYDSSAFDMDDLLVFPMIYHSNRKINLQNYLYDDNLAGAAMVLSLLLKSDEWKAEQEWRAISKKHAFEEGAPARLEVLLQSGPKKLILGNRFASQLLGLKKDDELVTEGYLPLFEALGAKKTAISKISPVLLTQNLHIDTDGKIDAKRLMTLDKYEFMSMMIYQNIRVMP